MRAHENPFRTQRLGSLAFRHPDWTAKALRERLDALGGRAAIVGPHGSGKTTLLGELGAGLEREGLRVRRRFLNADAARPWFPALLGEARALRAGDALLFDGAGHLPRWQWRALARAGRGASALLVTAHCVGLLPTLVETRTDAALLAELTGELLSRPAGPLAPLLEELREQHAGNLRDVFLGLYDLAARDEPRVAAALAARDEPGVAATLAAADEPRIEALLSNETRRKGRTPPASRTEGRRCR